jgi:MFS transporter, UMF1 family
MAEQTRIFTKPNISWMLYDWASSPVPTLHATFIFSVYFTTQIMPEHGSIYWSQMVAITTLLIGLASPFLGRLADIKSKIKQALIGSSLVGAGATMLLWYAVPDPSWAIYALVMSAISIFFIEIAFIFYNAWLASLVHASLTGRLSGYGWGAGYIGAIFALGAVLVILLLPDTPPFGLDADSLEHIRITMVIAGAWLLVFSLPLFLLCPNPPAIRQQKTASVISQTIDSIKIAFRIPGMKRFLLARMAFNDGLVTLFAFGGIYAAKIFGFSQQDILIFAIGLNITAGIGAIIAAPLNDRVGSLRLIRISLFFLILFGIICIIAISPILFWAAGLALGLFVGPCQSAARAYIAIKAPPEQRASLFGLFMLSGKATSFVGPLIYGWLVFGFGTERAGMVIVVILLGLGLLLLPRTEAASDSS